MWDSVRELFSLVLSLCTNPKIFRSDPFQIIHGISRVVLGGASLSCDVAP